MEPVNCKKTVSRLEKTANDFKEYICKSIDRIEVSN